MQIAKPRSVGIARIIYFVIKLSYHKTSQVAPQFEDDVWPFCGFTEVPYLGGTIFPFLVFWFGFVLVCITIINLIILIMM